MEVELKQFKEVPSFCCCGCSGHGVPQFICESSEVLVRGHAWKLAVLGEEFS